MEGMKDIIVELMKLKPSLNFAKSCLQKSLTDVYQQCNSDRTMRWPKEEVDIDDWVQTLCRRLRNGCRAASQALTKRKGWAHNEVTTGQGDLCVPQVRVRRYGFL